MCWHPVGCVCLWDAFCLFILCYSLHISHREDASVLVHGTEGTDSTLQITSLAQIILDPDCRTIRGFESLIVREWLQVSPLG